jgi:hypothetical protein
VVKEDYLESGPDDEALEGVWVIVEANTMTLSR